MATARAPPALRGLLQHYNRRHLLSTPRTTAVLLSPPPGPSPACQRRWARVHDVRFLATTQASRSVIEKYRAKLEGKARDEGLQNIDELKAAYADRIQEVKQKDGVSVPGLDALLADEDPNRQQPKNNNNNNNDAPAQGREQGQTQPQPSSPTPSSTSSVKPLSEILDLDKRIRDFDAQLTLAQHGPGALSGSSGQEVDKTKELRRYGSWMMREVGVYSHPSLPL